MTTKYKVIGRAVGRYDVPMDALDLELDIFRIELAMKLLDEVDVTNITPGDGEFGRKIKNVTISQIRTWKRYAHLKMRTQFLVK